MNAITLHVALATVAASVDQKTGLAGKRLFVKETSNLPIFEVATNGFFSGLAKLWMKCWGYECYSDKPEKLIDTVNHLVEEQCRYGCDKKNELITNLEKWCKTFKDNLGVEKNSIQNDIILILRNPGFSRPPIPIPHTSCSTASTQTNTPNSSVSQASSLSSSSGSWHQFSDVKPHERSTLAIGSKEHRENLKNYFDKYEYILKIKSLKPNDIEKLRDEITSNPFIDDEIAVKKMIDNTLSNSKSDNIYLEGLCMYFDRKTREMKESGLTDLEIQNLRNSIQETDNLVIVDNKIAIETNPIILYLKGKKISDKSSDEWLEDSEILGLRNSIINGEVSSPQELDVLIKEKRKVKLWQDYFNQMEYKLVWKGVSDLRIKYLYKNIKPVDSKEIIDEIIRLESIGNKRESIDNNNEALKIYFDTKVKSLDLFTMGFTSDEIKTLRDSICVNNIQNELDAEIVIVDSIVRKKINQKTLKGLLDKRNKRNKRIFSIKDIEIICELATADNTLRELEAISENAFTEELAKKKIVDISTKDKKKKKEIREVFSKF
jgi:hypothetical protein